MVVCMRAPFFEVLEHRQRFANIPMIATIANHMLARHAHWGIRCCWAYLIITLEVVTNRMGKLTRKYDLLKLQRLATFPNTGTHQCIRTGNDQAVFRSLHNLVARQCDKH